MAITAQHRGHCPECDGTIQPGDYIVMTADLAWAHEKCEHNGDPLATHAPVCPRCYIAHAGEECW